MKFPSLQSLGLAFRKVIHRFPLEIVFALFGTISATVFIELSNLNYEAENICSKLIMVANLGLVLSLSATLFSESRSYDPSKKYLLRGFVLVLIVGLFFILDPLEDETDFIRFFLLALTLHLFVSFAAFTRKNEINAFWYFNKTIFLRFLTGALYSAVLFIGLAAAIGSMNLLFNFKFEADTFQILWVWIAGIFQTIFFLSGVPEKIELSKTEESYPKGLQIFTQFVLIPLASVYVFILLAYEIKILIEWDLPKGLVSNLIIGYAVFGILSLLLVYPIRNLEENKWIKTYSRSFYFLLIPLIFLLVWAVSARVIDYGITEQRYFLIVLAIWLSFITAYFLLDRNHDIRIIPVSLCLFTLFTIYGPQGAFSVSKASQIHQLKELFNKYDAYDASGLKPLTKPVDSTDRERMVNVLGYLIDQHGYKSIKSISPADPEKIEEHFRSKIKTDPINKRNQRYQLKAEVKDSLFSALKIPGAKYPGRYGIESKRSHRFQVQDEDVLDIQGFRKMISFNSNMGLQNNPTPTFILDNKIYQVKRDTTEKVIIKVSDTLVSYDMKEHLRKLLSKVKNFTNDQEGAFLVVPDKEMIILKVVEGKRIKLIIHQIEGGYRGSADNDLYLGYYRGVILME